MEPKDKKLPRTKTLSFTCPDCGSGELTHCCDGFLYRKFIETVAYGSIERDKQSQRREKAPESEIRYACRPDRTEDYDFVEDGYGVDSPQWFACNRCDAVLEFEGGETVQNEKELFEWLLEHQAERHEFSSRLEEDSTGE